MYGTAQKTEAQNYLLGHLYENAYRAHTGTSFDPEKRALHVVRDYSEQLTADLAGMPEEQRERYQENYIKYLSSWLAAKSNCISTMITGGSNFPVRRAEKANASERRRSEEFSEWRERALKAIAKGREAAKPEAQKLDEQFELLRKDFTRSAAIIAGIDNGTERGCSRPLFVNGITGKIQRLAKNGHTELVSRSLDLIREFNAAQKKPIIAANNGIWKLEQAAEAARELKHDKAQAESQEKEFNGGKLVYNYQENRIQILFDEKPSAEIRGELKSNAYKWAPSAGVWQRQLTENAKYCLRFLSFLNN